MSTNDLLAATREELATARDQTLRLEESSAAEIASLREQLGEAQRKLVDQAFVMDSFRLHAQEGESRLAQALAATKQAEERADAAEASMAAEGARLTVRVASSEATAADSQRSAERASAEADAKERAWRETALEAELARASAVAEAQSEAAASAALAAASAAVAERLERENAQLIHRLMLAEAAVAGAAAGEREAARSNASAARISQQLADACTLIDSAASTVTARRASVPVAADGADSAEDGDEELRSYFVSDAGFDSDDEVLVAAVTASSEAATAARAAATAALELWEHAEAEREIVQGEVEGLLSLVVRGLVGRAVAEVRARAAEEAVLSVEAALQAMENEADEEAQLWAAQEAGEAPPVSEAHSGSDQFATLGAAFATSRKALCEVSGTQRPPLPPPRGPPPLPPPAETPAPPPRGDLEQDEGWSDEEPEQARMEEPVQAEPAATATDGASEEEEPAPAQPKPGCACVVQ